MHTLFPQSFQRHPLAKVPHHLLEKGVPLKAGNAAVCTQGTEASPGRNRRAAFRSEYGKDQKNCIYRMRMVCYYGTVTTNAEKVEHACSHSGGDPFYHQSEQNLTLRGGHVAI